MVERTRKNSEVYRPYRMSFITIAHGSEIAYKFSPFEYFVGIVERGICSIHILEDDKAIAFTLTTATFGNDCTIIEFAILLEEFF